MMAEGDGCSHPVTSDDVQRFQQDGVLLVRGLLSSHEALVLRQAGHEIIDRLSRRHDVVGTWERAADDDTVGATELLHCHDVHLHSAEFTKALLDDRLTSTMAALLGTPNVELHHNKLFIKVPERGSPFPLHQDWKFFPHAGDTPMAAIVHLDDAPVEKGCVHAIPGSFKRGRLEHEGEVQFHLPPETADVSEAVPIPAQAGDVLFFNYLTVHGSGVNVSDEPRTTWLIQVRDADDRPTEDRHRSPGQGTMLRGVNAANAPGPTSL